MPSCIPTFTFGLLRVDLLLHCVTVDYGPVSLALLRCVGPATCRVGRLPLYGCYRLRYGFMPHVNHYTTPLFPILLRFVFTALVQDVVLQLPVIVPIVTVVTLVICSLDIYICSPLLLLYTLRCMTPDGPFNIRCC